MILGVRAVAEKGPTAGYPVVDFKAVLYDGSFHTVDSDELSFRLAASMATRKGIAESDPVLLEPIMDVEVRVPEAYMGEVNRDLNTRRGRLMGMDADGGQQVLRAQRLQARPQELPLQRVRRLQEQAWRHCVRCPAPAGRRSQHPARSCP